MKIAIVTPWFTDSIGGGAERFAGGIAKCLQDAGCEVEIFTSCGKDSFYDWGSNFYPEGISTVDGVEVRRFALRKRNKSLYEELLGKLLSKESISYVEELQLFHETVNSDSLIQYIEDLGDDYIFLFIPYLYGTTFWGSKIRPERSFIIPCLHDEEMARFHSVGDMLARSRGLLFNTIEEQELAVAFHGIGTENSVVSGGGVEVDYQPNSETFREKYKLSDDYFIYVGRQVSGKNVPQLIEYFNEFIHNHPQSTKLLFVGNGEENLIEIMKNSPNIVRLGEISDQEKYDAIAGAKALIQPSLMESFSIVIMESWLCNTPVIVHSSGVVTKGHCVRSQGGWHYKDSKSFGETLTEVLNRPEETLKRAQNGMKYVKENYTWTQTANRIIDFIEKSGFERRLFIRENIN
ncbi:glycosyltransferase family 4 protein [Paenibacillus humicus]|uniref:glycosyltransferase family 4 protein n=1 Tax=Paenibacillus humicus TaxID=412861 RepID=UPI000FD8C58B|nr:glycosyltransferase family 4 protein [Paenibacillus humicus]